MYEISLEFNGAVSKAGVFVCRTKKEAAAWMRSYGWSHPKGHVFVVHKVSVQGESMQVDVTERYKDALSYAPNRNAWMDQRGRASKDTSVYQPSNGYRRA